jgi:hypothetical protein
LKKRQVFFRPELGGSRVSEKNSIGNWIPVRGVDPRPVGIACFFSASIANNSNVIHDDTN